jgi:hypothetical protein
LFFKVSRFGAESTTSCFEEILEDAFDTIVRLIVLISISFVIVILDVLVISHVLGTER